MFGIMVLSKEKIHFSLIHWTKEQCLLKIKESLHHITETPIFEKGRWAVIGITSEGIKIKTVIEKTGELVTSYPLLENYNMKYIKIKLRSRSYSAIENNNEYIWYLG